MTVLEKGKFIKNFVRTTNQKKTKLIRVPHSNRIGYSKADIETIEPKIDSSYWENWERFLIDKKNDEELQAKYPDYPHYLYDLNSISDEDIKKYNLPEEFIII